MAEAAAYGTEVHPAPGADSYHDTSIEEPERWRAAKVEVRRIGRLVFYHTK